MIPASECVGCRNNYYNSSAGNSAGRCWSAATGVMKTSYQIHFMQVPTAKGAFTQVRKPSCYHQVGAGIFYDKLPDFVKASDVNRAKRRVR
jgi:hypothetical protein